MALCGISPSCFLAECRKRRLNQGRFVSLYFALFAFCVVFSLCIFLYCFVVSIRQVIGCEDLQNGLDCVMWGIKFYCNSQDRQLMASEHLIVAVVNRVVFYL